MRLRQAAKRLAGTPLTRRAASELLYALIGLPVALVGCLLTLALLALGTALSITALGIPLLVGALMLARGLGGLHRGLARALLGEQLPAPPRRKVRGLLSRLGDGSAWRSTGYVLAKLPVAAVAFVVGVGCWCYGLLFLGYPVLWQALKAAGTDGGHASAIDVRGFYFDTVPRSLLLGAAGVLVLLAAPWVTRGALILDRHLVRGLLGPSATQRRVYELEQTRARVVDDSAATLRRIERDLHDGAQARMVALALNLTMAREQLGGDGGDDHDGGGGPGSGTEPDLARARDLVEAALGNATDAIAELRDLARGIHPPILDSGLDAALSTLAARSPVPAELSIDLPQRPPATIETIAYFCAAELLTNVAHHASARTATIEVRQHADVLRLRVSDDGVGDAKIGAGAGGGSGLRGLQDRVRAVDGSLTVDSPPGGPTAVTVELPVGRSGQGEIGSPEPT